MLILARHRGETIHVGDDILVTVVDLTGGKVRLGFAAPADVVIKRSELAPEWRPSRPSVGVEARKTIAELAACLRWYVAEDGTEAGDEPEYVAGKRRAEAILAKVGGGA